jgi:hypothetical protein
VKNGQGEKWKWNRKSLRKLGIWGQAQWLTPAILATLEARQGMY